MTDAERAELSRLRAIEADEFKSDTERAAETAWASIKKADDAAWVNLPMEIRHKLIHLAEKALAGRAEQEGDYAPVGFFAAVSAESPGNNHLLEAEQWKDSAGGMPDVLDGDVRSPRGLPHVIDEEDHRVLVNDLQSANDRVEVSDEALASQEPEFQDKPLQKGQLPDDFPGRLALGDEGINTFTQLRKRLESGEPIPGIGPKLSAKIAERLSE